MLLSTIALGVLFWPRNINMGQGLLGELQEEKNQWVEVLNPLSTDSLLQIPFSFKKNSLGQSSRS